MRADATRARDPAALRQQVQSASKGGSVRRVRNAIVCATGGAVRMGKLRSALVVGALTLGSVGLVACGSDSDSGDKGDSGGTTGKKGGTVKIGSVLPDNYDPVMFQTVQA